MTDRPGEGLRDRKKRQTHENLVRAALVLAAERGLDAVTVDDISAAAGVSPRTFFNYFTSKEDAVLGPDPEVGPRVRERVLGLPPDLPAVTALRAALRDEVARISDDHKLWLLRMQVVQQHPGLVAKVVTGGAETERQVAAAIAERLGVPPTDAHPLLVAAACGAALRVAMTRWSALPDPPPLTDLFDEALDLLTAGLPDPRPPA